MAIRYKVKVVNNPNGLAIKQSPTSTSSSVGTLQNGEEFVIDNSRTGLDGSVWFRMESTSNWVLYQQKGAMNLKLMKNVSSEQPQLSQNSSSEEDIESTPGKILDTSYVVPSLDTENYNNKDTNEQSSQKNSEETYVPKGSEEEVGKVTRPVPDTETSPVLKEASEYKREIEDGIRKGYTVKSAYRPYDVVQQNEASYPPVVTTSNNKEVIYDYSINMDFIKNSIQKVKENLNVPSAYDRDKINILMNNSFNRYNIIYPDYLSYGLSGVVFFTRPDLWLVDDNGKFLDQVENDPQLFYISRTNDMVLKQLTLSYTGKHQFIPLLCNTCQSLDVGDESVETLDIGETFSGYKMQYARHSIRSLVSGTFNCKFRESYDMAITHMMQAWCSYESSVYLGTMLPKTEYIGKKILDYACDAYLFIVDRTNTIKFFSKYYGVFPTNVNKSVYSFSEGDNIHFPEQNITFAYFHREDLNPRIIMDFNKHSKLPFNYKLDHESALGHGGTTWSGPPFVEVRQTHNGTSAKSDQFILRYRPK